MIRLPGPSVRLCDGISRRDLLHLGALGLTLPNLLRLQHASAGTGPATSADACVLIYLFGGPSQFETFDPKPDASADIRGEFGAIPTSVPGTLVGEHIPHLARQAHRLTLVRTCTQSCVGTHQAGTYEALTGFRHVNGDDVAIKVKTTDRPSVGSVAAKLAPGRKDGLRFVQIPEFCRDVGNITPGQFGGYLGRQYDPFFVTQDPNAAHFTIQEFALPPGVPNLDDRQHLLNLVDRQFLALEDRAGVRDLDGFQQRALSMLKDPAVRQAFDISREPVPVRERYGRNTFGQSCLLARRLVESGVKLVTLVTPGSSINPQQTWDTHSKNFTDLKNKLLPPLDRGAATLIEDLHERGLGQRTLVVIMGEFGRTPKINDGAGRDHWNKCYSILMAGGGIRGGRVHGRSDRIGAFPGDGRVFTPADMTATIYHCLGIDPHCEVTDQLGRPLRISDGQPMRELF